MPGEVFFDKNLNIKKFSAGKNHSVFLTQEGQVYSCGKGVNGQLGLGSRINKEVPTLVVSLTNKKVVDVACGVNHTLVLTS